MVRVLYHQLKRTGSIEDLDHVIETQEEVLESAPVDHSNRASALHNLRRALQSMFEWIGSIKDLVHAIDRVEESAQCDTAPPFVRLKPAQTCSNLLIRHGRYGRAYPILEAAVLLLLTISSRHLNHNDETFSSLETSPLELFPCPWRMPAHMSP